MKEYLANYFRYNAQANITLLQTICLLPDNDEAIRLFSHLINAQNKWYNRVAKQSDDLSMDWVKPLYTSDELENKWKISVDHWMLLLENSSESDLQQYVVFNRQSDNKAMKVKLSDIMFQLNCHSVHHRAQINKLISGQGIPVPLTDYIFTVLEEAS